MKKPAIIVASIGIALALVGGALFLRSRDGANTVANANKITPPPSTGAADNNSGGGSADTKNFTTAQLAAFDGKDGRDCYVAVDGTVYKIEQGLLWQNGEHATSDGQASCGRDLSAAIAKSPHGKSKLSQLEVMGQLAR